MDNRIWTSYMGRQRITFLVKRTTQMQLCTSSQMFYNKILSQLCATALTATSVRQFSSHGDLVVSIWTVWRQTLLGSRDIVWRCQHQWQVDNMLSTYKTSATPYTWWWHRRWLIISAWQWKLSVIKHPQIKHLIIKHQWQQPNKASHYSLGVQDYSMKW